MYRFEIINLLIKRFGYRNYLEIGLDDPRNNFLLIDCKKKESVDPYPIEQHTNLNCDISNGLSDLIVDNLTYRMTSDEFFAQNNGKYDIIFLSKFGTIFSHFLIFSVNFVLSKHILDCFNPSNIYK